MSIHIKIKGFNKYISILDEYDTEVTNLFDLEEALPNLMQEGNDYTHSYDFDKNKAFIITENIGKIKIKKIAFKYNVVSFQHESPLIIDADNITKAIIKDVKTGDIKFVTNKGDIK